MSLVRSIRSLDKLDIVFFGRAIRKFLKWRCEELTTTLLTMIIEKDSDDITILQSIKDHYDKITSNKQNNTKTGITDVYEFRGEYVWLSNFHPTKITYEGIVYPSVEHAFQAAKTTNMEDRNRIANMDAKSAKAFGKKVKMRPNWNELRLYIMKELVEQKFKDTELRKKLLRVGKIQEGNWWHDKFWGVDINTNEGENHLGRILEQVRDDILKEQANSDIKESSNNTNSSSSSSSSTTTPMKSREQSRIDDIEDKLLHVISETKNDLVYLDIGCSEGKITESVAKRLGLKNNKAFAIDVSDQSYNDNFTFVLSSGDSIPFKDNTFYIQTMFMCAHHFENDTDVFIESARVSQNNGYLLLREHNCEDEWFGLFLDVVHLYYSVLANNEDTVESFVDKYSKGYASYHNIKYWQDLAISCKWQMVGVAQENDDFGKSFYQLFRIEK